MVTRYLDLPHDVLQAAAQPGSVLLHSAQPSAEERTSWLYRDPVEVLTASAPSEVEAFLEDADARRDAGRWLAGYVTYEAGYPLVGVEAPPPTAGPAAWLGVYDGAWRFDHLSGSVTRIGSDARESKGNGPGGRAPAERDVPRFGPFGLDEETFRAKLERIHAYLAAGDTYQVNFTDRFEAEFDGDLLALYRALIASQPVPYAAFVSTDDLRIASLSPELFFRVQPDGDDDGRELGGGADRDGDGREFGDRAAHDRAAHDREPGPHRGGRTITARPMKGTAPRGRDAHEDDELAARLRADEKSRAENVMIVDLLRNDLGRVCEIGSVRVPELFAVERYRTVQQMTSTVSGTLREGVSLRETFASLFPCGSVTGAPKRRTMQIVRELERGPRGVYTGAIGHAAPDGGATFNVAIRTLVQRRGSGRDAFDGGRSPRLVLGAGGGIVADSDPAAEYRECLLKARFATHPTPPFELIETMRFEDGYRLLDEHLARLRGSADYFGFAFDEPGLRRKLRALEATMEAGMAQRVRVLLAPDGSARVTAAVLQEGAIATGARDGTERLARPGGVAPATAAGGLRVALADERVDSSDPFLRHKTTRRRRYDAARERAAREGLADVLFLNERGELAEGAISNVFLEIGGDLLTPPLDAGVLPGVYRGHMLATHPRARVATLGPGDLDRATAIYLCSALRGLRPVSLAAPVTFHA